MRNMENKVISREYVEKNYIHKDRLREYRDNLKLSKEMMKEMMKKEYVKIIDAVIDTVNYFLEE